MSPLAGATVAWTIADTMHRTRASCAWLLVCSTAALGQAPSAKGGTALGADEIDKRLEAMRAEIVPKVMPAKTAADPEKRKAYLAKWQAIPSEHYLIFTNGPTATCRKYATSLERLYGVVKKELNLEDIEGPLQSYIFATKEEYYAFTVQVSGWTEQAARATAGHSYAKYYATYYESPTAPTVFHEATHEIVAACLNVPSFGTWVQEGVAVYFEKKLTGEKPEGVARSDLKRGDCYPLSEFFAIPVLLSDPKGNGARNYAHAGAMIDFMLNTKLEPVSGKFGAFLKETCTLGDSGTSLEASTKLIQNVYGLSVAQFEALWHQHLGVK